MFFNAIKNNLNIKSLFVAFILISSIAINQNSKANFFVKKKLSFNTKAIGSLILFSACASTIYFAIKCLIAAKRSGPQADALENFRNNNQNIDVLSEEALNQYNNNTLFPSSESVYSDYPLQHFEHSARSNKNYLKYALGFFSDKYKNLGNRLETGLNILRNNKQFKDDKKAFNHENREDKYRKAKTREGFMDTANKAINFFHGVKHLFS